MQAWCMALRQQAVMPYHLSPMKNIVSTLGRVQVLL
jgi:hypothetical protein